VYIYLHGLGAPHFKSAAVPFTPKKKRLLYFSLLQSFRTFRTFNQLDYLMMQFAVFFAISGHVFFSFKSLSRVWFYSFDTHQIAAPSRSDPEISPSKMLVGPADPQGSQRRRWWCKHLGLVGIAIALFRGRCLLFNQLGLLRKRCVYFSAGKNSLLQQQNIHQPNPCSKLGSSHHCSKWLVGPVFAVGVEVSPFRIISFRNPIGSMGLIYLIYIYYKNQPNVGKYTYMDP